MGYLICTRVDLLTDEDGATYSESCGHIADQLDPMILDFDRGESLLSYTDEKKMKEITSRLRDYHAQRFTGPSAHDIDWLSVHKSGISKAVMTLALYWTTYDLDGGTLEVRPAHERDPYQLICMHEDIRISCPQRARHMSARVPKGCYFFQGTNT